MPILTSCQTIRYSPPEVEVGRAPFGFSMVGSMGPDEGGFQLSPLAAEKNLVRLSRIAAVLLTLLAMGCAAPGTPLLRSTVTDGEGPLIAGCKNVSSKYRVEQYITSSYLSMWGSAWLEGATQGLAQGSEDAAYGMDGGSRSARRAAASLAVARMSQAIGNLGFNPTPFRRSYAARFGEVARAVREALPLLGNRIMISDEENGYV